MVPQMNSGSRSSSTVEMDTILEKTVLLLGQCNNIITYEKKEKCFIGRHRDPLITSGFNA